MGFGRWGVLSEHFQLVWNDTPLLFPNTALCWVFLFAVAPFTHFILARLPLLLPLMSCFLPIGAVVDWASLQTIQWTKDVAGTWSLRHGKLLCLPKTIAAATSVLPSFGRDWPAGFVLPFYFSLPLHLLMSFCVYLHLVIASDKDTPRW